MTLKIKKVFISSLSNSDKEQLFNLIKKFDKIPLMIGNGKRNVVKTTSFKDGIVNIKSFKIPNLFNKIVYRFFRKSKAQRSFEYANKLLTLGINTPKPFAYFEYTNSLFFGKSFYVSKQLKYDFSIREIIDNEQFEDAENIIRQFTRFTFKLHEKGINFLDHSPGNTLIIKEGDTYHFYLIDLNRMKFQKMNFNKRMKNFAKLSSKKFMNGIIANEYAKLYPAKSEEEILINLMLYSDRFKNKFLRKQAFKKKYFFWRKK